MSEANDYFAVRGKTFFNRPFFNNILSTNISVYKYLADMLFDGDMGRIVWSSIDRMFYKRQEQLAERKVNNLPKDTLGILDMPFCSLRLLQDGIRPGTQRNWWNPALHTRGMWFEELGRRLTLTPATINYEACFCCNHDTDLFMAQQDQIWDKNAETILESFVDATANDGTTHTLKNIIIYDAEPHVNQQFAEKNWLEQNKIQTITLDITCQTWLIAEDEFHRYSITKKVLFDFITGAGYNNLVHGEGTVDGEAERVVWDLFMGKNVSKSIVDVQPDELKQTNKQLLFDM